jgi:flagellar biosynthesis protein FlhG
MRILPIASGKGGVGKSLLAANLAIALAENGNDVILSDLDLGGSNLHLILGVQSGRDGIGTYLNDPSVEFSDIVMPTDYERLRFIPGDAEIPGIANLTSGQKRKLIRQLTNLEADFLVLDLGAGTSYNIMDFFLMSGNGIVVTTPTPTATVNAYLFLKNAVFRLITTGCRRKTPAHNYLEELRKDARSLQKVYLPALLEKIRSIDPESHETISESMSRFHPRLVLNMLEEPKDSDKATRLRRSSKQYLDLDIEHLGIIYRDELQSVALSSRLPIIVYKPQAVLSTAVYRIADKIIQAEQEEEGPIDWESLSDTYETASAEAEIDFGAKLEYLEDLLNSGTLSTGDLVETVKTQQLEIQHLKKENALFKSKLVKAINAGYVDR